MRALLIRGAVEERSPDRTPSYPLGLHPVAGGEGRGGRARTPSVFLLVRDLFAAIAAVVIGPADGDAAAAACSAEAGFVLLTPAAAAADAAAWRAEVKRFRGARLGRRNGLTPRPTAMCTWWVQPAGRAGGRSWGPGGSWQAQSGAVMAARCHQSFKAAALPGRCTRRLAGREHVDERTEQRRHDELCR